MYHNPSAIYDASEKTLETFMAYDSNYNKMAGIYELDQSMKFLQRKLDEAIACIADDVEVTISFQQVSSHACICWRFILPSLNPNPKRNTHFSMFR